MRSHPERGSVLMADLMLAAVIVLIVAATASAAGTVAAAEQANHEAARNGALWAARTGDLSRAHAMASRLAPGGMVTIRVDADHATVVVATPVDLAHPVLSRVRVTTTATVAVPVAPYRSNRD